MQTVWRNQNNTKRLDLTKVAYSKFISKESIKAANDKIREQIKGSEPGTFFPFQDEKDILEVYISGDGPLTFEGQDALDIYTLLSQMN